jgi:hypothetical protein
MIRLLLHPRAAAAVLAALALLLFAGAATASAGSTVPSPLTAPERQAMGALRDLAVQRIVVLQSLPASVPEDQRPALWALTSPLIGAMRETSLAATVLEQARIARPLRRAPLQPAQKLPAVPIIAMCVAVGDPMCDALGHSALTYLGSVRVTSANASQLLAYVVSTAGRVKPRVQRRNLAPLLKAIRTDLVAERTAGLQLVAQLGAGWDLMPSTAAIEAIIAGVSQDPWSVVNRQRAAILGYDAAAVRRLIARGVPAARALEHGDLVTLLGADYRAIERGLAGHRAPKARAAQGLTERNGDLSPRPGIAAGRTGDTGDTGTTGDTPAATPCVQTADCSNYQFTSAVACALAKSKSGTSATMTGAVFSGCDLKNLDATLWTLGGASFATTDLTGAKLRWAPNATFDGITLDGADLTGAHVEGASFVGTSLVRASLDGAYAEGANFDRADLTNASAAGTNFAQARHLDNATLRGAYLDNADLTQTPLTRIALDRHNPAFEGLLVCGATIPTDDGKTEFYPADGVRCDVDGFTRVAGN